MSWKDKFSILGEPRYISHEVQGETHKFYILRTSTALKLKSLAKPIGRLLSVVFEKKDKDGGLEETYQTRNGEETKHVTIHPIAPETLRYRGDRLDKAMTDLIALATDDKNTDMLVMLITDSMRDDFEKGEDISPSEFLDTFTIDQVKDMLIGVAKANAKVFGPFQKAMTQFSARAIARVQEMAEDEDGERSPDDSQPAP
jgi:hypothetical protein